VRGIYESRELRQWVDECSGVMILAHPFRKEPQLVNQFFTSKDPQHQKSAILKEIEQREIFGLIDVLEAYNGQSGRSEKKFCEAVAEHIPLKGTGGSDAHAILGVGSCYTVFEKPVRDERDLIDQLKEGCFNGVDDRWQD
jgi:hypothetical protein